METLKNLAESVGLDISFFWQFLLLGGGYFAAKALFLKPYALAREKRKSLTQGRFAAARGREKEAEALKSQYGEKARALHKKFQDLFGKAKAAALEEYKSERARILKEHEAGLERQTSELAKKIKAEALTLEKDIPALAKALKDKISPAGGAEPPPSGKPKGAALQ